MTKESLQNNYRRGVASLVILSLLKREDMYGYQLVQETERSSGGLLTTQEGSLYPLLYRMVDSGYISGRDVTVETRHGRRRNRVLYHLEPSGRVRLSELKAEFDQVQEGIQNVFLNSVPIGYEREEVYEHSSIAVPSGSEEEDSLFRFPENGIPVPIGG